MCWRTVGRNKEGGRGCESGCEEVGKVSLE